MTTSVRASSNSGGFFDVPAGREELNRIEARLPSLWPPGPYTLGLAAGRVTEAVLRSSRSAVAVLTMLTGEFGVTSRIGTVPALLSSTGIVHTRTPMLNARERVLLGL